jgi:hypothetical protein
MINNYMMKLKVHDGHLNTVLTVHNRKDEVMAELKDPQDGKQISVVVHENAWTKKYQIPTHTRYFRTRMDAMRFIKSTFK